MSQLLDGSGAVVAAYNYDPFGNVTAMAGAEAEENPWRFSTKPEEAGTGWLYYGYRWYDSGVGRWVNRDPIEESGGLNLYGFVRNEPVRLYDPLGLEEKGIVVTIIPGLYHDPDSGEPYPDDDEADMREAFERYNLSQVITAQNIEDANSQLKKCKECIKVLHIEGHGNIGLQVIGSTLNPNKATEGYLSREVRNGEVILKGFDLFKGVRFCTDQKCKIIFHGCYVGKGITGMDFLQQVATDTKCYAYGWSKLCNRGRPYSHPHGNLQPDTVMFPK